MKTKEQIGGKMARVGDVRITKEVAHWRECEGCGLPARYRLTFLFEHFRSNPASSAYREDDCSWCSDLDVFTCERCKRTLSQAPSGYNSGCGIFTLKKFKHMGFYWKEVKLNERL